MENLAHNSCVKIRHAICTERFSVYINNIYTQISAISMPEIVAVVAPSDLEAGYTLEATVPDGEVFTGEHCEDRGSAIQLHRFCVLLADVKTILG